MRTHFPPFLLLCFLFGYFVFSCAEKAPPPRTDIPVIKEIVSRVEAGVRDRNRAALDSLMSVKMLDHQLSSDSLIALAWNSVALQRFAHFSDCDVKYTDNIAQCDCGITDENGGKHGEIQLTFSREDKHWLLHEFKSIPSDSTHP